VGSGLSYKIYYNTQNDPARASTLSNLATGTSMNITGLGSGTNYYFWVSSVQGGQESGKSPVVSVQTAAAVPSSQPTGKIYKIGDTGPAGGIVFYDKGSNTGGWRYLEAAPRDLPNELEWGPYVNVSGTNTGIGIGTGKENTQKIVSFLRNRGETNKAAQGADAYSYGGYDDRFLPSKDELNLLYVNLKQKGLGNFEGHPVYAVYYWSSSEASDEIPSWFSYSAWCQDFSHGMQVFTSSVTSSKYFVRAVRAF
jgi:hypothetical protein